MLARQLKISLFVGALLISGCSIKPPVQEMAEARSAVQAAQQLEGDNPRAEQRLQSAEEALKEAADAIDQKQYERARRKAVEAKIRAQQAARIKQSDSNR